MNGIMLAWMVGEGIIIYRTVNREHRPPMPGELLASSGLFVVLALLGQSQPKLATTLAVGFDAAAFLNLFPQISGGSGTPATGANAPSTTGASK